MPPGKYTLHVKAVNAKAPLPKKQFHHHHTALVENMVGILIYALLYYCRVFGLQIPEVLHRKKRKGKNAAKRTGTGKGN